jgi:hypothetical protein
MKSKLLIAMATVGSGAAVALLAVVILSRGNDAVAQVTPTKFAPRAWNAAQPDISSPNWKMLSDDVGVMIRDDDSLGLRGRLYVRVEGSWYPVATDGPADAYRSVPLR